MFFRIGRLGAVGQAADHRADLADDLAVVERHRRCASACLGARSRPFPANRAPCRRCPPASGLRRSTGPGCSAQREGVAVMAVRFLGSALTAASASFAACSKRLSFSASPSTRCGGVDAQRLTATEAPAGPSSRRPRTRPEIAVVEFPPRVPQRVGERFGIEAWRVLPAALSTCRRAWRRGVRSRRHAASAMPSFSASPA